MSGDYMLGFVSALSSTLAIVVLIASVLLVNVLSVSVKKSQKEFEIKITDQFNQSNPSGEGVSQKGTGTGTGNTELPSTGIIKSKYVLSAKDLPPKNSLISKVTVSCSYGNNFNYDVASKLLTINYIILEKHFFNTAVKVVMQKPVYDENKINDCSIVTNNESN
ncbi:hypothetical protein OHF21_21130 [Escherichia coli]|uniref:Uncharacterized protein n=2 Tax=Gammaproteobacteria TaxID=1236 RepID=A0A1U9XEV9_ECOLX|nr:hypothetical protein [Escherichia coli]AQZ20031.1 hypothetical protein 17-2_00081 [Escherichia coli]EEU1877768.1 hypothetical protein [Escherichia coli]EEW5142222.1 hypothetical protein [Escherichia coli]EEZ8471365.1 hypothetical protein [Escherichia coli]EFA4455053.1 hypothetical protein [Escherichia coli]